MEQELVLSPTSFIVTNDIDSSVLLDFLQRLKSETLLCDADNALLTEYREILQSSGTPTSGLAIWVLPFLIQKVRRLPEVHAKTRLPTQLARLETEKAVATKADSKVVVAGDLVALAQRSGFDDDGLELLGVSTYLDPPPGSHVRSEQYFQLKRGEPFPYHLWLAKFVKDATDVRIVDGYMLEERAIGNLIAILKATHPNANITLETLADNIRRKDRQGVTNPLAKMKEIIKDETDHANINWVEHIDKSTCHDRELETEKFLITLGRGLDCYNPKTGNIRGATTFQVSRKRPS